MALSVAAAAILSAVASQVAKAGMDELRGVGDSQYGFDMPQFPQSQRQPMDTAHLRSLMGTAPMPGMPLSNKPSIMKALGGYGDYGGSEGYGGMYS